MPQKVVTSPLPIRENYEEIPIADVDGDYKRVVFNESGENFLLPFQSEEEKIAEITAIATTAAETAVQDAIVFDYATLNTGNTVNILNANFPYDVEFSKLQFNSSDTTKISYVDVEDPNLFKTVGLKEGYLYKVAAHLCVNGPFSTFQMDAMYDIQYSGGIIGHFSNTGRRGVTHVDIGTGDPDLCAVEALAYIEVPTGSTINGNGYIRLVLDSAQNVQYILEETYMVIECVKKL